ncbi:hypothetical protein OG21DRAFT_1526667 [Imleria badia]|nr:hypothetical protein OG21DRAFT_1526667 [Imleria badia]
MTQQDENPALLQGIQKPVSSKFSFSDWTILAIILAQMILCIFAWTFASVMMREGIAMPDDIAIWIYTHLNDYQTILTLVSTILGLAGSLLLRGAVRRALVRRLSYANTPLRLHTMVQWAKLAQGTMSQSRDKRYLWWTLLSVLWIGLLHYLIAAWTSLLAPWSGVVVMQHELQGSDFDILGPSVYNFYKGHSETNPLTQGLNLTPSSYIYSTNVTTGGIYPPGNLSVPPSSLYLGIGNPYQGILRMYNVTQRGFTADISCRTPTSNDPVITLDLVGSVQIGEDAAAWVLDTYSWTTNCSSEITYSVQGVTIMNDTYTDPDVVQRGLLMTSVCYGQSFTGSSNQSFLVLFDSPNPNSSYSTLGPQICQVTPLVTTVQAIYDPTGIINVMQPPLHGPFSNMMDKLVMLYQESLGNSNYSYALENFLQGMMEYAGSVIAQRVGYYETQEPAISNSEVQFNGILNAYTIGWIFILRTHGPALIALTLVTLLTLAAGGLAMFPLDRYEDASTNRKPQAGSAHAFDPTATMDVLLASSAGDLARVLSESKSQIGGKEGDHDSYGHEEGLRIVLGMTDTGRPALRTG